ncbi:hypothetical protein BKA70DRAFT_1565435 [Coprinopsis sp. MPI-PUGE-AT-0042]|nr:hypothetical protein BKA70DRAFT_1565435 [Coprinopsis sp. MPI-PUGE-AT-0042]
MERDGERIVTGSQAVGSVSGTTGLSQDVHGVSLAGGNLSIAGGDVHYTVHCHAVSTMGLSVLDSVPNFRGIHIATSSRATQGTGSWVRRWEIFWLWLNPEWFLMILWGFGMPGAGKTILASIVINILEEYARASAAPICICYIYFRYSDHAELTVRGCLETLVKQTIERHPHCVSLFDEVYARHIREKTQPSEEELLALLRQFVGTMAIAVYALDALDEAPPKIQLELLQKLVSLNVKLFVTSRPLKTLAAHFPGTHHFPIVAHNDDITLHINQEISRSVELFTILQRADQSLHNKIVASVIQKCGGMFLHASLQLAALRECTSVHEVEQTLAAFPTDIEDLYLQTWQRILAQSPSKALLARNALTWVVHATRSLTIWDLQQALATSPDAHKFVPDRLIQKDVLIGLCHGLLNVEEKTQLVRLVHYTAKGTVERLITETSPQPHALLAAVCLARLADSEVQCTTLRDKWKLKKALEAEPFLSYAYDSWFIHARQSLADPFTIGQLTTFVMNCHAFPVSLPSLRSTSHLLDGFDVLGPLHLVAYFNLPITLAGSDSLRNPNQGTAEQGETALNLACRQGHDDKVKELLHLPNISVNAADEGGTTALMWASIEGHVGAACLLIACPGLDINATDKYGWTALLWASLQGHKGVVALLLSRPDVDINLANQLGSNALLRASERGDEEVVMLLLSHPDVNVNASSCFEETALTRAVENGRENIVKLLLAHPSIWVGTRELEAARTGGRWATEKTREARLRIIPLLEELLNRN